MNPVLLAALLEKFATPVLLAWLRRKNGQAINDADAIALLEIDADKGIAVGTAALERYASDPTP